MATRICQESPPIIRPSKPTKFRGKASIPVKLDPDQEPSIHMERKDRVGKNILINRPTKKGATEKQHILPFQTKNEKVHSANSKIIKDSAESSFLPPKVGVD